MSHLKKTVNLIKIFTKEINITGLHFNSFQLNYDFTTWILSQKS